MSPKPPTPDRRQYTKEFKQEAVRLAEEFGVHRAAKELGIGDGRIYAWRASLAKDGSDALRGQGNRTALEAELTRLRRENHLLRMEKDILKKATTYFAKLSE